MLISVHNKPENMESAEVIKETKMEMAGGEPSQGIGGVSKPFATAMIAGIIALIALIHFGFFETYIKFFPKFESGRPGRFGPIEFNWIMHAHGIVMMGWVFMLLVQPIMIRSGKKDLHRRVGKLSYVWAPLVVLSLYLANQDAYHRNLGTAGEVQAVAFLTLTFPGLIFFAVLYGLAMYYKKTPHLHMRFMCSTAFLFIPPALDRALVYIFQLPGYNLGSNIQLTIIAAVVILDSIKTKRLSPFMLVFCFELIHKIIWHSRETEAWQMIGRVIAKLI
jgi:uncharacterized membrane protein YozB (DUF420 family)